MPDFADLYDQLELPQCHCLNESSEHTIRHCLDPGPGFLESDADEELLLTIKFMQAVKVSGIVVEAAVGDNGGPDVDTAPTSLKLFKNKVGLDFDSAKSDKPTEEVALSASDVKSGAKKELRFVNFQGVQELSIFIGANHGDGEVTRVGRVTVLGELVLQSGLKRTEEQQKAATAGDWGSSPKM